MFPDVKKPPERPRNKMDLTPSGPVPEILHQLPKSPREWTAEQREASIQYIATLPLPVIRKRQGVITAQMQMPRAQKDPDIMADLQEMHDIESAAVANSLE